PAEGLLGQEIESAPLIQAKINGGKSNSGYLLEWNDYFAPAALYELLDDDLVAKVVTSPFEIAVSGGNKKFNYGTILIPVAMQSKSADDIFKKLASVTEKYGLGTYSLGTANASAGSDPGSSKMIALTKPSIAM